MDEKIIDILTEIRSDIKRYAETHNINFVSYDTPMEIDINFPILSLDSNIELNKCSIHGVTYIDVTKWINIIQI